MASKSDEYRKRAQEAEDWAKNTQDPATRQKFEQTARNWRELADRVESGGGGLRIDVEMPPSDPFGRDYRHALSSRVVSSQAPETHVPGIAVIAP